VGANHGSFRPQTRAAPTFVLPHKGGGAIGEQGEQLHPARIDPGERLVGASRQAGDGPVEALGRPGDGDAGGAVETKDVENVLRLRKAEELFEAAGELEALLERLGAVGLVKERHFAFEPGALLVEVEELPQTGDRPAIGFRSARVELRNHRGDAKARRSQCLPSPCRR
jgi:hypothetical protein